MKSNEHAIKTINDIYRIVAPETTEAFLADFSAWLRMVIAMKKSDPERTVINVEQFTWIDDGKNELRGVHLKVKGDDDPCKSHRPTPRLYRRCRRMHQWFRPCVVKGQMVTIGICTVRTFVLSFPPTTG